MMNEVCTKVDILIHKYLHKSFCQIYDSYYELIDNVLLILNLLLKSNRYVVVINDLLI